MGQQRGPSPTDGVEPPADPTADSAVDPAAESAVDPTGDPVTPTAREARGSEARPPEQGVLFEADTATIPGDDVGYRGPTACAAAGITYRQLDYWARTGLVEPTIRGAAGSGTQRLYSFRDILVLRVVKRLLDAGVSLQNIRAAVAALRQRGIADLARITLLSDGTTVYELTSADEVVDLLQGGQAVFAIAVGRVVQDVGGSLADMPSERADAPAQSHGPQGHHADELSQRRRTRGTA